MLIVDIDKKNYVNLVKLIRANKKIFLLCYSDNNEDNFQVLQQWNRLQFYKKYIPSNDIILATFKIETNIPILDLFPRIKNTGKGLPRVIFIDGLRTIEKYSGEYDTKNLIEWIKNTLILLSKKINDNTSNTSDDNTNISDDTNSNKDDNEDNIINIRD